MKKIMAFLALLTFLWSCANDKKETPVTEKTETKIDSTLVTDSSWGPIKQAADFAEIQAAFGASNVKDERICGAECVDSVDVTIIYPGSTKEIIVYWEDSFYHKDIAFIQTGMPEAPYHTAAGLKTGSSLNDLLKINGQKITFSGFGWDYGGSIQSYNNGSLEKSPIHFELDLAEDTGTELLGDIELNTDMPAVKKVLDKIKVYRVRLSW
ncbi:MAG: hypothetical protein H7Y01_07035 [Ferruginibacter sp.]|nr:hypothetical protein [Chitinophagaceae bacterium]